jgi:hypothetical protein
MPVRGTTVALHSKEVVILEANEHQDGRILCAWADCDEYGHANHQIVINDAKPGFPVKLMRYVFCSDNCRHYWSRSHIPGEYGSLRGSGLRSRYM